MQAKVWQGNPAVVHTDHQKKSPRDQDLQVREECVVRLGRGYTQFNCHLVGVPPDDAQVGVV